LTFAAAGGFTTTGVGGFAAAGGFTTTGVGGFTAAGTDGFAAVILQTALLLLPSFTGSKILRNDNRLRIASIS